MKTFIPYIIFGYLLVVWLLPPCLLAQNQTYPKDALDIYGTQPHQEKVFVHTDKPYYLTGETLWYKAYCTNPEDQLQALSSVLYVELFDPENQSVIQVKTALKSGLGHGQIMLSTKLSTGSYKLRAYTAWMRNQHQDYFFQQNITVINPLIAFSENSHKNGDSVVTSNLLADFGTASNQTNPGITVETNKDSYSQREAVTVDLMVSGSQEVSNLSVSVYPFHGALENNFNNIQLPTVDSESHKISVEQETAKTHYFHETIGPIAYGSFENSGSTDVNGGLFVSIAGPSPRLYQVVRIDSNNFAVELPSGVDYKSLYFWSTTNQKTNITVQPAFDGRLPYSTIPSLQFDSSTVAFIEGQSVNMQLSNLYQEYASIHGRQKLKTYWRMPFYGQPEAQFVLDDYTRFPSLEEVFIEYIKYVSIRKKGGISNFYIWDFYTNSQTLSNNVFFDQPALLMLDGVPVDFEWVLEIDPLLIESIDVVTKKYFIGNESFSGVINLHTYNSDFAGLEFPVGLDIKFYHSLQNPRVFHLPNHGEASSENARIPDRRNTLYWNPSVKIATEGPVQLQFYTGDATGEYLMVINGITTNGTPLYQTKKIRVIKSNTP